MKLPATLFNTDQGRLTYALKALGLSLGGALVISVFVGLLLPDMEAPVFDLEVPLVVLFFGIVIFSPVIETLIMWPIIALLGKVTNNTLAIAVISALVWAILHSLQAPAWGLVIFWSFVVFSIAFIEWRRHSIGKALGVTMLIHGGQNLCAFILLIAGLYFSDPQAFVSDESDTASAAGYSTTFIRPDGSRIVTAGNGNVSLQTPGMTVTLQDRKLTLGDAVIMLPKEDVILDLSTPGNITLNGTTLPLE